MLGPAVTFGNLAGDGHFTTSCCRLLAHLKAAGIHAVFHYVPLHTSPMGAEFGYKKGDLPVTEDLAERLVRLPFYHEMFLVPAVPLLASSARIG